MIWLISSNEFMDNRKYYVVWEGFAPGIFSTWEECKQQIDNYPGAKYKSFPSKEAAQKAFRQNYKEHVGLIEGLSKAIKAGNPGNGSPVSTPYFKESIAVDAACSGNPGKMEYRGVYVRTGQELFKIGPYEEGTNNIGEFLAIVHGLALLKQKNSNLPIYSDSVNAQIWVKQKKCKTKLERTSRNQDVFELIDRAEKWLRNNTYTTPIYKWETKLWGEIPADFGRK